MADEIGLRMLGPPTRTTIHLAHAFLSEENSASTDCTTEYYPLILMATGPWRNDELRFPSFDRKAKTASRVLCIISDQ